MAKMIYHILVGPIIRIDSSSYVSDCSCMCKLLHVKRRIKGTVGLVYPIEATNFRKRFGHIQGLIISELTLLKLFPQGTLSI